MALIGLCPAVVLRAATILINPFEVPQGQEEEFLKGWHAAAAQVRAQQASSRVHHTNCGDRQPCDILLLVLLVPYRPRQPIYIDLPTTTEAEWSHQIYPPSVCHPPAAAHGSWC